MTITEMAKQFNLDETCLNEMAEGVASRIKYAMENGEVFSDELVVQATQHWFESRKKYTEDLLANKNGSLDKLCEDVYDQLKK